MTSGLWNSINSFASIIDNVSQELDSNWNHNSKDTHKSSYSSSSSNDQATKTQKREPEQQLDSNKDKYSYYKETITTQTSKGALPRNLLEIPSIINKTAKLLNHRQSNSRTFIENMASQLNHSLEHTQYYFIISSVDYLAECSYEFENTICDERVTLKNRNYPKKDYRVIVFPKGYIKLFPVNTISKPYYFSYGIRSGFNFSDVKWKPKSSKESRIYGAGNQGWQMSAGNLNQQMARIDIFYLDHIQGIRIIFANGRIELLGRETGKLHSFTFTYDEYITGATITVTDKLYNVEFQTNYGRRTGKYGYQWQGCQYDISFNGCVLYYISAMVYDGIENIKFHWI